MLQLEARRAEEHLTLWYQSAPADLRRGSRYRSVLSAHRFASPSDLRPDMVLRTRTPRGDQWLVIEAKMGTRRSVEDSARAALNDLLAYRRVFDESLRNVPQPYGIGIVWGRRPCPGGPSRSNAVHTRSSRAGTCARSSRHKQQRPIGADAALVSREICQASSSAQTRPRGKPRSVPPALLVAVPPLIERAVSTERIAGSQRGS